MIKQQNVKLGFALAMLTAVMWGIVPIAMKYALAVVDPLTLAWSRLGMSAIGITIWLAYKKQFPNLIMFKKRRRFILLMIAGFGLLGNFALFASAVQYLSATTAQVVGQTGIVIFMIASAFIFKERLRPTQIIGILVLLTGLVLFFNKNIADLFSNMSTYGIGVWLGLLASVSWASYALAQKVLLRKLRAEQLLWLIYLICTVFLWPLASPSKIAHADATQLFAIIFCGLNTIIAYGALVMAMERWQAAQVSAITTLTPLFSLIFSDLFALIWPEKFAMQYLNILGYIGAISVVAGAMFATIGHHIWQPRKGLLINRKKEENL
ncbi:MULTISPECIES: DMT family transporter [unclassified Gilliamella]|uniref:DMT family transporter n=1 Tax=unclassified Gilliamella TaxID=2685620 RepID=UPI002269A6FA|nr:MULTISPECIES: DMT family transporter [unclassified Gilliamella]MCX8640946.1 DMT family transporter [Gilliamella sp. B3835]MCX8707885.1 DMT family transporter [Gilliamella sp. B3783]MCX8710278.1 DMT family transporter [Gilliamella sp. B3780]MCX8712496.1 DMT family transporter [Gilliamella sp. B3468]MCX8714865.1 DMT family transporter [Gilliamella sp. B3781]